MRAGPAEIKNRTDGEFISATRCRCCLDGSDQYQLQRLRRFYSWMRGWWDLALWELYVKVPGNCVATVLNRLTDG
jgi:hypothetical protein